MGGRLVSKYAQLICSTDFKEFQNQVSHAAYEAMGAGFARGDNEVALVTKLVEAINGKSYDSLRLLAQKIHGSRSYVEFFYRDKPVTKELADMVILSVASAGGDRIFQKICFIQNKVSRSGNCEIDQEQLFLLKNFPPFSGKKGLFRAYSSSDIHFINNTQCLGAYGLFEHPGELLFVSAPLIAEVQKNTKVAPEDISFPEVVCNASNFIFGNPGSWDAGQFINHPYWLNRSIPFLENSIFCRDAYDFVRNWTQFNIGEPTLAHGKVVNPALDTFAVSLLREFGLGEHIKLPETNLRTKHISTELAVMIYWVEV